MNRIREEGTKASRHRAEGLEEIPKMYLLFGTADSHSLAWPWHPVKKELKFCKIEYFDN